MTPEMINAIAGLWKLVSAVTILFALFIFRKPIEERLGKLSRLKTKDTEVEFTYDLNKIEGKELEAVSPLPKSNEEVIDKKLTVEEYSKTNDTDNWFGKMLDAFYNKKPDEAKSAFEALIASEVDGIQRLKHEVLYNYFSYIHLNKKEAISELQKLSETESIRAHALFWLSLSYKHSRTYKKAKLALESSIDATQSEDERAFHYQSLIELMLEMELPADQIFSRISSAFSDIKTSEYHYPLFRALAEIYKKIDDKLSQAVALEKALELNPDNTDLRFKTAYAQSEARLSHLAISNYETLLRQEPENSTALNNLGVELDRIGMKIYSIKYYKKSVDKKNSLAMANIAYSYLDKGFVKEAEDILNTAKEQEDVHPNVSEAISTITKHKEQENQKWEVVVQTAIKQKAFFVDFAEAKFIFDENLRYFGTQWKYNGETFDIEEKEGKLTAFWGTSSSRRKLTGEISGRSANINFYKQSTWITDREYFDSGNPGLCYVNAERSQVHLLILSKDKPEIIDIEIVQ